MEHGGGTAGALGLKTLKIEKIVSTTLDKSCRVM
jgi:hypothetical protein